MKPVSLYAETKVEAEGEVLGRQQLAPTCLRFATVYGTSPRMRFDLTVNEFTRDLEVLDELVVFGEQFWRPYVHVRDAASAIALVLEAPLDVVAGEVFNVGDTRENYRKLDLVEILRERFPNGKVDFVHKDEDPRDYRVKFEKLPHAPASRSSVRSKTASTRCWHLSVAACSTILTIPSTATKRYAGTRGHDDPRGDLASHSNANREGFIPPAENGSLARNAFTVDVEDWYQSCLDYDAPITERVLHNVDRILVVLDDCNVKGSFFVQEKWLRPFPSSCALSSRRVTRCNRTAIATARCSG